VTSTAIRVHAGPVIATVAGPAAVTKWVGRYFTPWWNTVEVPPVTDEKFGGPWVEATVESGQYTELAESLTAAHDQETLYARTPMFLRHGKDGTISAVSPSQRLAYLSDPACGLLEIIGCDEEAVATATARLAREAVRGLLLRSGWVILHASAAATPRGEVVLSFGGKGAGKSTTAFTLARTGRWSLLANDRVFARPLDDGRVQVLPWPSAAGVGLGLLDTLGWYDIVRERLEAGESLHPTQDARVTEALLAGRREPLWDGARELKAQVWPHQFADWFGLDLAGSGELAAVLFPAVGPDAVPGSAPELTRALTEDDFMAGATEDRYPDVLGLVRVPVGGTDTARAGVAAAVARVPHHGVALSYDPQANTAFLDDFLKKLA